MRFELGTLKEVRDAIHPCLMLPILIIINVCDLLSAFDVNFTFPSQYFVANFSLPRIFKNKDLC